MIQHDASYTRVETHLRSRSTDWNGREARRTGSERAGECGKTGGMNRVLITGLTAHVSLKRARIHAQ